MCIITVVSTCNRPGPSLLLGFLESVRFPFLFLVMTLIIGGQWFGERSMLRELMVRFVHKSYIT